jgi:hypothetical protein
VHDYTTNITNRLTQTSKGNEAGKHPFPVPQAKNHICNCEQPKVRAEESVRAEIGIVAVDGEVYGALD